MQTTLNNSFGGNKHASFVDHKSFLAYCASYSILQITTTYLQTKDFVVKQA